MIFFHISDLHIGKNFGNFSFLEDQRYILNQIAEHVKIEKPQGIIIAGDIFDRPVPSEAAVSLLDSFLTELASGGCLIFMISGNHDSPERIGYTSKILEVGGLYTYGLFNGQIKTVTLPNPKKDVVIHLLPFIRPTAVRNLFADNPPTTYNELLAQVFQNYKVDTSKTNILAAHQFVSFCGREHPDAGEYAMPGGVDIVDGKHFAEFDYVALGHLHRPQEEGNIRYCGSVLKYSFSETFHSKSITKIVVDDDLYVDEIPLEPLRDMRKIRGALSELIKTGAACPHRFDYILAELTDTSFEESLSPIDQLRRVYPNIMGAELVSKEKPIAIRDIVVEDRDIFELFEEFFSMQTGSLPNDLQKKTVREILKAEVST